MLELRHIVKKYDEKVILNDISLTVEDGEIISILGPSGGGKTTLLNVILGITPLSGGQIIYNGEDLSRVPMQKRGFNIVFQDYALFPNLTAYQNIVYGLRNKPGIATKDEVADLIRLLDLQDHVNKRIGQLSGGQKQRVALARTLVMKPKILLLDEPLSALDGVIKESIKERIRTIAKQYHLTTIIVTHDPEEALTLSHRVLILNGGKIAQFDTPDNIIHAPKDDFIKKFILSQSATTFTSCLNPARCLRRGRRSKGEGHGKRTNRVKVYIRAYMRRLFRRRLLSLGYLAQQFLLAGFRRRRIGKLSGRAEQ